MKKLSLLLIILCSCSVQVLYGQVRVGRGQNSAEDPNINYATPKEYEIAEITITGLETLSEIAIKSLTGLEVGDRIKIPGDAISNALKKIWGQGIIDDVSINATKFEGDKVYLNVFIKERPRLRQFIFEGVNKTQESELTEKISLYKGRVLTDALMKNTELTIKNFFIDKGYLNVEVVMEQIADSLLTNNVQLKINVDKNPKVKVNKIIFEGNEEFSDQRLKKQMKSTHEHVRFTLIKDIFQTLFSVKPNDVVEFLDSSREVSGQDLKQYLNNHVKLNFFNSSKFIKEDYETDKDLIIAFYNSKGYRDATIVEDSIYKHDENSININIEVEEGKKYYFRDILWTGNYVYTDEQLARTLGVETGDVYDMELINKRLNYDPQGQDISSLYMDDGYLLGFSIQPVEVRVEGDSIDVEMRINEGPQAYINKVYVTGNDKTNDHVILREIRTLPGQIFNRSEVIRTQRELAQLGYFDPEQVNPNIIPNPADGNVDIEWQVVERPSDQIELSGGWGGAFRFVGTLGLSFNNFSLKNATDLSKWRPIPAGDGQKLSLRVQANGRRLQTYSISFSEPWLGGKRPNALSVNFTHSAIRDIDFRTNEEYGFLKTSGVTFSLGRRVKWPDDYFQVSNSISYLLYDLFNYRGFSLGFQEGTGRANSLTFNNTIIRSNIDQAMYPRSGSQLSLSTSVTPPYSLFMNKGEIDSDNDVGSDWIEYHKWMFDAKYYLTLAGNLVLESRAHFGFLGSYGQGTGISPFERFTLGGSGLGAQGGQNFFLGREIVGLRGYEDNSLQPRDQNGIDGGVVYNKFVMELRYPVSLAQAATIYVLAFAEAGNTWNNYEEFNPYNIKRSAGVGARIFMPAFGLIGIDWGYGFDTLPGQTERSGAQFHFTIGQQIR